MYIFMYVPESDSIHLCRSSEKDIVNYITQMGGIYFFADLAPV